MIRRLSVVVSHLPQRTYGKAYGETRSLSLSSVLEPRADGGPIERPCTLLLAQDVIYTSSNWHTSFTSLPTQHGISYAQYTRSESVDSVDTALQDLWNDVGSIGPHQTVLVAKGPWHSWLAQFYLESLSLAGLVMVDPLPLDDRNGVNQLELLYKKLGLEHSTEYSLFQEFVNHWDHWTLKLEPGAVPMLVIQTIPRPAFAKGAAATARRHSGGPAGNVPVLELRKAADKDEGHRALDLVVDWIDDCVL